LRIAVIGAGVTGLVAGHRLSAAGHAVDVYERWPGLGGQAATLDVGGGHRIERYYHHLFTSDRHIADLYAELGLGDELEWLPSSVAIFSEGRSRPFTSPLDLLRFTPLSVRTRLRMGLTALALQRGRGDLHDYEQETARSWIERRMGSEAWAKVWGPILRGKFGDCADELSMAWLWKKLTLRRQIKGREAQQELLGYPRRSFEPFFEALQASVERGGGRVLIDRPAAAIARDGDGYLVSAGAPDSFRRGHDPRRFDRAGAPERYDGVIATVPSDVFDALLDPDLAAAVGEGYLSRMRSIEYYTALCLVLELDRRFSPYYWTNVADGRLPFVGLIEHTNLVSPDRYGGRRFLYVANYRAPGDPLLELEPDELLAEFESGLRAVNPAFSLAWVKQRWLFREPAAQPIVTVGYQDRIPPLRTGVPGLVLANTTQIYPEDRGTNYSVRLGGEAVEALGASIRSAPGPAPPPRTWPV
jgi:protoporphyrinogen oxidase